MGLLHTLENYKCGVPITNNGFSSGAVSFMELFNTTMNVARAKGVLKRELCCLFKDIDHPDIEEFLTIMILEVLFKTCFMEYASRLVDETMINE